MRNHLRRLAHRVRRVVSGPQWERHALVGPPELWRMKRKFQIRFLRAVGLRPDHLLLDLGCGTLRGGVPIIDYLKPGNYYGVDVRADVLDVARREAIDAGLAAKTPHLVNAPSLTDLDLGQRFDVVWAFSVLIHLDDAILDEALGFVARHLAEDGSLYANVNVTGRQDRMWMDFPFVDRSVEFYADRAGQHGLEIEDLGPLRDHGHRTGRPLHDNGHMLRAWRP